MKAITTKYHGPTNTRGSRYSASDCDGNKVVLTTDFTLGAEENHDKAAIALLNKMRWGGNLMRGSLKSGYVYVFDDARCRVKTGSGWVKAMDFR